MSDMNIMNQTGHTQITWDAENAEETRAAREMFEEMTGEKGYQAFRVRALGGRGERIKEFDPKAEKIILAPQLKGG